MKKYIALVLALTMLVLTLASCGKKNETQTPDTSDKVTDTEEPETTVPETETTAPNADGEVNTESIDEMPLAAILDQIITGSGVEFGPFYQSMEATEADIPNLLGYNDFAGKFDSALFYGPAIGSIAFTMILFRLEDGADAKAFAADIKEGCDPRKWVCVQADTVETSIRGNTIMFVMADTESLGADSVSNLVSAFNSVDPAAYNPADYTAQ